MDIIQVRKIITFKKLFIINCLSKRDLQAEHTEHSINENLVILKLRNLVDTSYDLKKNADDQKSLDKIKVFTVSHFKTSSFPMGNNPQ